MTRDEFRKRYRHHLIGCFFDGGLKERTEGPIERARRIDAIPADVDRLLDTMFNDLIGPDKPPAPSGNGQQAQPKGTVDNGHGATSSGKQEYSGRR